MLAFLQRAPVLWATFAATILLTIGFGLWIPSVGGIILDETWRMADLQEILGNMDAAEKRSHFWMTLLLDIPYPFAYGGFFAGMILRFYGKAGPWLALPALIVIPVDLAENTVQMITLAGDESLLYTKGYLTPLKLALYIPSLILTLIAMGIAAYRRFTTKA